MHCALRRFKVYTKTGDKGEASLYNGKRRAKTDPIFAALGDVDECNACIGVAAAQLQASLQAPLNGAANTIDSAAPSEGASTMLEQLAEIQSRLLDVGSAVATPLNESSDRKAAIAAFDASATAALEQWIDAMDECLPPLTQFILPGGGEASARLHVARAVCRRAERAVVALGTEQVPEAACVFMNRLSDYLFVAARKAALDAGAEETTYKKAR